MTDPITWLLIYCLWTLALVAALVAGRGLKVVAGRARADAWPAYQYDPSLFLDRLGRAYLNSVEILPVFAALVLAAVYTGQSDSAISVALWVVVARMCQSIVHLIGVNHWLVQVRFFFFLIQLALMAWLGWQLLVGWLPY